jgi:two-component sensor histidine kinase
MEEHNYDSHDIDFLTGFANILAEAVATANRTQLLEAAVSRMEFVVREKDQMLTEMVVLAQELQHRIRNNLQLVNAMVSDQLSQTEDERSQHGLRAINRRIMVLARVYDHLLGVGMSGRLNFGDYVESLCEALPGLRPAHPWPISLKCEAQRVELSLSTVTALGLVVSELVSNAYLHAFPDRGGEIAVAVFCDESDGFGRLIVSDNGIGYQESIESKRHGIGLVRRLAKQVGASIDATRANGTCWTIRSPAGRSSIGAAVGSDI